jgi:hypothetical protein
MGTESVDGQSVFEKTLYVLRTVTTVALTARVTLMGEAFAVNEAARAMRGTEKRIMGLKRVKILKALRAS